MSRRFLTSTILPLFRQPVKTKTPGVTTRLSSSFLQDSPAPPRLPAEQQAEFERLQREAEAKLHSHTQIKPTIKPTVQSPESPIATSRHTTTPSSSSPDATAAAQATSAASAQQEKPLDPSPGSLSGGIRQGAPPEFEGEKNPKTGEIGGPKNEPLRWGSGGDWSYNGRVTDF